ncbi:MAG: hypothetical protein ABL921_30875 [Pirellula sp.]
MKRTTLISASLLLAFAGCTCGGWRPNLFSRLSDRFHGASNVGEPCDAGCHTAPMAAPMATAGCESCGNATSAHYGGYEGQIIDSYEGVPVGAVNSMPSGVYTSPTYPSATSVPGVRMGSETVRPKPAN